MQERQPDEHERDGGKGEHGDDPPLLYVRFRELVLWHQPLVEAVDGVSGMDLEFLSFLQKYAYSIIFVYYKLTNKFYGSERLDRRGNDLIVGSVL